MYFSEKYNLRRRLAVNLGSKSADSSSVEYSRTLPRHRLDLPPTLFHDASAGRSELVLHALRRRFVSNIARKSLRYGKI